MTPWLVALLGLLLIAGVIRLTGWWIRRQHEIDQDFLHRLANPDHTDHPDPGDPT